MSQKPPALTIAYFTSRRDPKIRWFFDSLHRETGGDYTGIKVVVVDFHAQNHKDPRFTITLSGSPDARMRSLGEPVRVDYTLDAASRGESPRKPFDFKCPVTWVAPKPTVWQGPHRLTKADYFAASNARNTAICHAPDGYIAFVDDLSVLLPGWLKSVREAQAGGYIALGAYKKMKKLVVENGEVVSFEDFPGGVDSRWNYGSDIGPVPAHGQWMFGCSLAAPVEAFLEIGGYPEVCDGLGSEDYCAGMMIERNGHRLFYDRRMLTYESEEDHAQLPVMLREDPFKGDPDARPRDDMSHAVMRILSGNTHPGYFGEGGIRALRESILAGGSFPVTQNPQHRWFDGVPLADLPLSK